MYCSQCGRPLNKNGSCPACSAGTVNPAAATIATARKPLTSYAWLGPIVAIISTVLYTYLFFKRDLLEFINFELLKHAVDYNESYLIAASNIIAGVFVVVLPCMFSFILFKIVLSKQPLVIKKISAVLCFLPAGGQLAVFSLFSCIFGFAQYAIIELYYVIVYIVFCLVGALVSFVLLRKCFSLIEELYSSNLNETKMVATTVVNTTTTPKGRVNMDNAGYAKQGDGTETPVEPDSPKSKAVAALLCFFLGALGVHRFYAGKIGTGVLWLLTAGLFGIGSLVDFFIILFGGFQDAEGRKIR